MTDSIHIRPELVAGKDMAMPSARATHEPSCKRLGLAVGVSIALALSGCDRPQDDPAYGVLRMALSRDCMAHLPVGPSRTQYNDWDEVVSQCDANAEWQANSCKDHIRCLQWLLAAQGMETRHGGNEVPSRSDDSPVRQDAPKGGQ